MAEQATTEEEKKEDSGNLFVLQIGFKLKASKELFDKRKNEMDLTEKADFKEGDKFGCLCDDGVLIECEVIRPHSKGGKLFVSLGEHHGHLTENHSIWIDLPNTHICSLEKMSEVQMTFKRIKSTESAVDSEIQNLVETGSDKQKASEILNNLTKQPSVLKNIADSAPAEPKKEESKTEQKKDDSGGKQIISLLSVASKSFVFSTAISLTFKQLIFNWLRAITDFFSIFVAVCWVFYSPKSDHLSDAFDVITFVWFGKLIFLVFPLIIFLSIVLHIIATYEFTNANRPHDGIAETISRAIVGFILVTFYGSVASLRVY